MGWEIQFLHMIRQLKVKYAWERKREKKEEYTYNKEGREGGRKRKGREVETDK